MTSSQRPSSSLRSVTPVDTTAAPILKGTRDGPSFTLAHRIYRLLWRLVWTLFAVWTPPGLSPWRILLLRLFGARVGAGAAVAATAKVWFPRNLDLGAYSSLGPGVNCYNMALITIGARTVVSQGAVMCAGTHDINDPGFQLIVRPITIGNDVWIASEAFVGPGVSLGDACVLGARGCAFSSLDANMVYRGNPAQAIKERRRRPHPQKPIGSMRIACVLGPFQPVPPVWGGAVERIWQTLCEEFAARGHEVTLLSRSFAGYPDEQMLNGVRYIRLKSYNAPHAKILYRLLDVLFAFKVCRSLPSADITITNSVSLPLMIPRSRAGRIYMSVARFPKGQMGIYGRVDRIQPVSSHVATAIRLQSPSVAHLIKVVPNAISETFAAKLDLPRPPPGKQIIFVGRIAREKGIHLLIRGFATIYARHPGWSLKVIGPHLPAQGGDGEQLLAELRQIVEQLGVPVTFVGPVFDEADLSQHLLDSQIFVYPSIAARGEALPLAPVEAMACGCPVLVSTLDCFLDYLIDGTNGLQFDETDETGADLGRKLELLIQDPELRRRLGTAAVETARKYTRQSVATQFLDDFSAVIHGQPGRVS